MDQLRDALRSRHYSRRTEQAYALWVRRFIYFHETQHPAALGEREINAFLTHLAVVDKVSASTQTQALSALLFLYRNVIGRDVGSLGDLVRAHRTRRLPVVMTREEVRVVLDQMDGDERLMASLMYGTGMRLMECLRLRVQDIDFERNEIMVRNGKGSKDRVTMLPRSLKPELRMQLKRARVVHQQDLAEGWGRVPLPGALERKYPNASAEWRWQGVFPQRRRWKDTRLRIEGRHHVHETVCSAR
jgi:integron integrase